MKLQTILRKAYTHIFQIFSANLGKAFFGFVGSIFVLRGWSASNIGDIYTLVGVMLLCQQFGDLGTGSSFIQIMSRSRSDNSNIIRPFLGFKHLVVSIIFILLIFSTTMYFFVSKSQEILGLCAILIAAIIGIYAGFFTALITARQEFTKLSILKVVPAALKSVLIIVLYFVGYRTFGWLLIAFIFPNVLVFMLGYFFTQYPIFKSSVGAIFSKRGKQLYEMSRWVFLIGFFQTWFSQIDIFMLKRMSSDYQIAQFISAQKLSALVLLFSQAIFTVMLPKMKNFTSNKELKQLQFNIFYLYLALFVLMFPATLLAPYVVPIIMGGRYLDSIPILKIFMFQALGHMAINSQSLIFYRKKKLPALVIFTAAQLGLNFLGNYLVIYEHKALGVTWVSAILNNGFYLILFAFCYGMLRKKD